MEKYVKKVAILLSVLLCICFVPLSAFADVLDDKLSPGEKLMYQNFNYVWGQETSETGITCPKCGTAIRKIDHFTCPNCGYNSMVVDSDGKTTFTAGGGKAGSGVGRPKAYKDDNTPTVTSSGLYTMYVHPQFCLVSGIPQKAGTFNAYRNGVRLENSFFSRTIETNRLYFSFKTDNNIYFTCEGRVYYKIVAPVTGHYEFKEWSASAVESGNGFLSLDSDLSIKLREINLSKGNTEEGLYFYYKLGDLASGQFTYINAPDLVVKYTPYNGRTNSYQPLEKVPSIKANDKEITGTIYHDPVNNYYYSYDSENNCTIYVENKKGDIIGDITYNTTENTYVTNIYPGATTGEDTPTPDPTGKPGNSSGSSWWDKLLSKIGDAIIDGLLGAVSAVLKLIFKLFSTILSWIIWAVSRVFDLLPFLPPGLGGLLVGGVVVCFVIGIIKFIRG